MWRGQISLQVLKVVKGRNSPERLAGRRDISLQGTHYFSQYSVPSALKVFRQVSEQTNHPTFRFYSAPELLKAKPTRCSFCTLLLSSIRKRHTENKKGAEKFYETKSRRPLIAEIQFYTDLGLVFKLWHHKKEDWDFLTSITLKFSDAEIWFGKGDSLKTRFLEVATNILFRTPEESI